MNDLAVPAGSTRRTTTTGVSPVPVEGWNPKDFRGAAVWAHVMFQVGGVVGLVVAMDNDMIVLRNGEPDDDDVHDRDHDVSCLRSARPGGPSVTDASGWSRPEAVQRQRGAEDQEVYRAASRHLLLTPPQ
jgi:hypothetical protein